MTVTDYNAMAEGDFRRMLRAFIAAEYPPALAHLPRRLHWPEIRDWSLTLSRQGWLAPAWPVEHGGMGLDAGKLLAYHDEFDRAGVARAPDQGIVMLGMLLLRFGTEEQKRHYLPRILSWEDIWCQGYSEPGAGSDLASLRTMAVDDGDAWVVSGQKTWTTLAQDATDIFLLARTDPAAKKQEGISFLLVRMDTPGLTVRPIRTLSGEEEFCEVFLDEVRVPKRNIVGRVNQGWSVAKALLGFERLNIGSPKASQVALSRLAALGRQVGGLADAGSLDAYTRLHLDVEDLITTYGRFADRLKRGGTLGPETSILKLWGTETHQRITERMVELAQEQGVMEGPAAFGAERIDVLANYYLARAGTIYGGSNEVQRNILAKSVLGLP